MFQFDCTYSTKRTKIGWLRAVFLVYNNRMVEKQIFVCPVCGLHYYDEEIVKKCEAWCTKYKSCNLEFIKHSLESQKQHEQVKKD